MTKLDRITMITSVTIYDVEFDFKEGKKVIQMVLKEAAELEKCKEGLAVCLTLKNGEVYTGLYGGMVGGSEKEIILRSLKGTSTIGLKPHWVENYLEEIK